MISNPQFNINLDGARMSEEKLTFNSGQIQAIISNAIRQALENRVDVISYDIPLRSEGQGDT